MTEKKKRQKVVAEITLSHLAEFAGQIGRSFSEEDALAFLNGEGRAYEMWKRMMLAGEEYFKTALKEQSRAGFQAARSAADHRRMSVQ